MTFHEFVQHYKLDKEIKASATTCQFEEGKSYVPPGEERTRNKLFGRELSITATGEKKGLVGRFCKSAADLCVLAGARAAAPVCAEVGPATRVPTPHPRTGTAGGLQQ